MQLNARQLSHFQYHRRRLFLNLFALACAVVIIVVVVGFGTGSRSVDILVGVAAIVTFMRAAPASVEEYRVMKADPS
ncbi:hypothetical protein GCM10023264_19340 [Sphingomonas daechungensis]|uniref:Uncharacterized protein n=1 Tax=Sphingomonas daechungensis TaxID=1176646 RepID=A0ABX6T266_9SPHN|nr:hypothetical protein [Sphingomonas daechungensis]QNP43922.1 hypothetical protein H9L15_04700 [Sphingomonas daechungensis]